MQRRTFIAAAALVAPRAFAHHGWSSFDQSRPIYLEGKASQVAWRNPHAGLVLELAPGFALPADLGSRVLPPQAAPVDGPGLLKAAALPRRNDARWQVELAPISRMQAWKVPEIKNGDGLAVLGFTFPDEKGEAVLRVEYLFAGGRVYGLRSAPV